MIRLTILLTIFLIAAVATSAAFADTPIDGTTVGNTVLGEQQFLKEYPMGVFRHRIDGGRVYGWKIGHNVTLGRFKGETDEFGFSIDLNRRDRVEVTTDGLRWRRALGGPR